MAGYEGPPDRLELYEAALDRVKQQGRNDAVHVAQRAHDSFIDKEGTVAIRLSPNEREEFFSVFDSGVVVQYGREMNEFAEVPDTLLEDTEGFGRWLRRSYEWVATLKPK